MTTIHLTLELPDEIARDAQSLGLLESASLSEWLEAEVERLRLEQGAEADWEASILAGALGKALLPDGSIDFEILTAQTIPMMLDDLDPESASTDER